MPDRATRAAPLGAALLSTATSDTGRYTLRTLFVGLCLLLVGTQASAAAKGNPTEKRPHAAKTEKRAVSLQTRLELKLDAARKYRSVLRFFRTHRRLLSVVEHRATAQQARRRAARRLARVTRNIATIRHVLRVRARRLAHAPPKVAICDVFGRRYCGQALDVAWCESRHSTRAQNGQYQGLFQMGWYERRLFGHGSTARQQARAAHRYFIRSGRDWSPWSCKPSYVF